MKILCDKEGKQAITQLCDVALKVGGLKNMDAINQILGAIKSIEEEKKGKPKEK